MEVPGRENGPAKDTNAEVFTRLACLPATDLVSEEDVKIKAVLPMLRVLGYTDSDFNYEHRTGRGYVDVVVERLPTGIVVEAKAPRKKLAEHIDQLETYVFQKHDRNRVTVAVLTDGESFNIYGVTEALWKGSLGSCLIKSFMRSELKDPALQSELYSLLGRLNNQNAAIFGAVTARQNENRDRLRRIDEELSVLNEQRQQVDARIQKLQAERTSILGPNPCADPTLHKFAVVPHILRLLRERGACSKSEGVERKWLDQQLINKVDGVKNDQAVSFGLIELKKTGQVDYVGRPIRKVWLR